VDGLVLLGDVHHGQRRAARDGPDQQLHVVLQDELLGLADGRAGLVSSSSETISILWPRTPPLGFVALVAGRDHWSWVSAPAVSQPKVVKIGDLGSKVGVFEGYGKYQRGHPDAVES